MTNFLNLPDWNVTKVTEADGEYVVEATYIPPPACCVHCGCVGNLKKHATRQQEITDLPSHGNRVRIALTRTRHWCKDCGKTFLQPLPDVDGTLTKRLIAYIERQSLKFTFAHVAAEVGVDEKTVRNLFTAYTNWLDGHVKFATPKVLGLDEVFLLGKPRCVAVSILPATIIGVLEDRNKATVHNYLFWLPDKEKIEVVTMDMWKPYKDAVRACLPGAVIVVDKFHIVRMATKALETVRRGLREDMTATKRREVMRSRFLLLRRERQLTDEQKGKVEEWATSLPTLGAAYRLKEGFYGVFDLTDRAAAEEAYRKWEAEIPAAMRPAFKDVTTAMRNWHGEVFAYFDHRYTNATTEALNGLTKIMNRTGRGYSFRAVRAKMLFNRHIQTTGLTLAMKTNPAAFPKPKPQPVPDASDLFLRVEDGSVKTYGTDMFRLGEVLVSEKAYDYATGEPTPPLKRKPGQP